MFMSGLSPPRSSRIGELNTNFNIYENSEVQGIVEMCQSLSASFPETQLQPLHHSFLGQSDTVSFVHALKMRIPLPVNVCLKQKAVLLGKVHRSLML